MTNQQYEACINACNKCALTCNGCITGCLQGEDVKSMTNCILLCLDCAQICQLSVAFMARGSKNAASLCKLCADICEACATECEMCDMQCCTECAQACRHCAEECKKMGM